MNRRHFIWAAGILCGLLAAGYAQAKPNFSGDWKMSADKSDFGPMPAPDKMTQKIDHSDPKLKVNSTQAGQQGEFSSELNYTTDGKESANTIRGNEVKSIAKWDGDALVIDTKMKFQDMEILLADKWTLSEDGKIMTIARKFSGPQGELEMKIVLEKQ